MSSFLGHNPLYSFLPPSNLQLSSKQKQLRNLSIRASISLPARDRVIDFGKYKGRMLGSVPSSYLKWVRKNLNAGDFLEWARLAEQVLQDPVYKDRLEWEVAEKYLTGDILASNSMTRDPLAELLELSQRFGWDNEDKVGWSKVDFKLLGTSKGGRIPRVKEKKQGEPGELESVEADDDHGKRLGGEVVKGKREERRERMRMKRGVSKMNPEVGNVNVVGSEGRRTGNSEVGSSVENVKGSNPFPGRESLLKKALSRRSIL